MTGKRGRAEERGEGSEVDGACGNATVSHSSLRHSHHPRLDNQSKA